MNLSKNNVFYKIPGSMVYGTYLPLDCMHISSPDVGNIYIYMYTHACVYTYIHIYIYILLIIIQIYIHTHTLIIILLITITTTALDSSPDVHAGALARRVAGPEGPGITS